MIMKIAIYSPYFPTTIGGGERVLLETAAILKEAGHQVFVVFDQEKIKPENQDLFWQSIEKKLNLKLQGLTIISGPFGKNSSFIQRLLFTKNFDRLFYMTDGSLFLSWAKKNIVHFQIPLKKADNSLWQKIKIKNWHTKTANSLFTKQNIEKNWKMQINYVQRGCVDLNDFKPSKKSNLILTVGRFFSPKNKKHCKKQDFLIKSYLELLKTKKITDWSFSLVGGVVKGADNLSYLKKVKDLASKQRLVSVKTDASFTEIKSHYAKASIYWHSAGFGINEITNPTAVEHFGIAVIEAMASGCVPVVVNKGGLKEIVENNKNGFVFETQKQLIDITSRLIKNNNLREGMSKQAVLRARQFSKPKYRKQVKKIFAI
jgi:glycosyltransferase involved in cell wall biosynthesis